jgi:hypothetical protein
VVNKFPIFNKKYLPGHLEAGIQNVADISYSSYGNRFLNNDDSDRESYYVYNSSPDKFYKKYEDLQEENDYINSKSNVTNGRVKSN